MLTAPMHPAIERFVTQLSAEDLAWLALQLQTAQHEPPADWVTWRIAIQGQVLHAGHMPFERAVQMAEHVPGVRDQGGIWLWDTGYEALHWRSTTLQ